jgi:ribosomal protein S7
LSGEGVVRRTIRGERYELPLKVIPEIYVQKSVGWLLKVASRIHPDEVITYLEANITEVKRETLRTAIEKLDPQARRSIMALRGSRVSTDTWAPVTK